MTKPDTTSEYVPNHLRDFLSLADQDIDAATAKMEALLGGTSQDMREGQLLLEGAGRSELLPSLLDKPLASSTHLVREQAARFLEHLDDVEHRALFERCLTDEYWAVRHNAIRALWRSTDHRNALGLMEGVRDDGDETVREAAQECVAHHKRLLREPA